MKLTRAALLASTLLLGLLPAGPAHARPAPKKEAAPTLATRMVAVQTAKTINYYPANAGWSRMWTTFDTRQIDADLARAQSLGATSVRALVFPQAFGYPNVKAEYASKLATFVSMAAARGMTVKLTLFDWWDAYDEPGTSLAWAKTILAPYRDDKRIVAVELKNELDTTDPAAMAWAKKIVPAVRAAYPNMPLTLSVDGVVGATGMAKIKAAMTGSPLDFYDFHFYGNSERALATIRRAQAVVAPTPMVIGEAGVSTQGNTEGEQAAFLARVFQAATLAGIRSVAPWTLNDFAAGAIPESEVAGNPVQYRYGLYTTTGVAKPAAAVVKAGWAGTAMPASLMDLSFESAQAQSPWRAYLPELGRPARTIAVARTGKQSVSMTGTDRNSAGSPSYRVAPIIPVQPGQKWHAEVFARGSKATGSSQIALSWFDVNDKWLGGAASPSLPAGNTGWVRLTVDGVAPTGAASVQVHLKSGDNSGTVWFDDVAMSVA